MNLPSRPSPASLALSSEELHVLAVVSGVELPAVLKPTLSPTELALAERVTTRTLLAHGLLANVCPEPPGQMAVVVAPGAAEILRPLFEASVVVSVTLGSGSHLIVRDREGIALSLHERERGVWRVEQLEEPLDATVARLLADAARASHPLDLLVGAR